MKIFICFLTLMATVAMTTAQAQFQTPHIQAVDPPSAVPGTQVMFTITGYGFNNGPTVIIDGSAVSSTLVSAEELQLFYNTPTSPTTVLVTVKNSAGAISNAISVPISNSNPTIGLSYPVEALIDQLGLAVADFNGDSKADIAGAIPGSVQSAQDGQLEILTSQGNGSFTYNTYDYTEGLPSPFSDGASVIASGDFNGDGLPDVVLATTGDTSLAVLLNTGSGFAAPAYSELAAQATGIAIGNFSNSGKVDLAVASGNSVLIYQGQGNGLFQLLATFDAGSPVLGLVAADFNQDDVSDIVAITSTSEVIYMSEEGKSEFTGSTIADPNGPLQIVLGDFDNGGYVDAAILESSSVTILDSAGNGTFTTYSAGATPSGSTSIQAGDFNSDGRLDLAVFGSGANFLINVAYHDWQLQSPITPNGYSQTLLLAVGDFNLDGKLDLAAIETGEGLEVYLQGSAVTTSPTSLTFNVQPNQTSPPQTLTITSAGSLPLIFSQAPSITNLNTDNGTFTMTSDNCPTILNIGTSCQVQITYTAIGVTTSDPANLTLLDNATGQNPTSGFNHINGGVQYISLTGNNLIPLAYLSTGNLKFPNTMLNTTSNSKMETLENVGSAVLNIAGISIKPGTNAGPNDFQISANNCGSQLAAGTDCQISVNFTPSTEKTESARLIVTDNDSNVPGSTQGINLTGTGVSPNEPDLTLSATSLNFGNLQVGQTSGAGSVTLTNIGAQPVVFSSIALTGTNPGDFALVSGTNACSYGAFSLAPAASCKVFVTFTPTANGARSATVTLTDNNLAAANATQTIALNGSGEYGAPLIDIASPTGLLVSNASAGFTLILQGANLNGSSVIGLNGTALTTSVSGTEVKGVVPAGLITTGGTESITVTNPGDPASNVLFLPIATAVIPAPEYTNASGSPFNAESGVQQLTVADFNGDGKPDLVSSNSGAPLVWLSQGNGTFTETAELTPGAVYPSGSSTPTVVIPFSTVAGDFNGDGKLDLAEICQPFGVVIFLGNGQGGFTPQAIDSQTGLPLGMMTGAEPQFGVAADFNNDGILDIATANQDGTVSILLALGNAIFNPFISVAANAGPLWGIAAGDFNGDGNADLVVSAFAANTVIALLGNGQGGFTPQTAVATGTNPLGLTIGDFNADGQLDVAVANAGSNTVSILLGNGNGTFTAASAVAVGTSPISVATGDVNGDGKLDLVVANNGANSVSMMLGNGNGTFTADGSAVPTGTGPAWVSIADWNNDGKLDWATANNGSGTVSIMLSAVGVATPSSNALGFGKQSAGVSKAQNVVLVNTGSGPLVVTGIAISGASAAHFQQTNTCGTLPAAIVAGSSCVVSVAFDPLRAGAESATLTFTDNSNGTVGSAQTVSLSGTGVVTFTVAPSSVAFNYEGTKIPSRKEYVEITNSSAIAVTVSGVTIGGADAGDFSQTNTCGSSLAAGAGCIVTLVFTPAATGARSATLAIADGATGSPQTVALSGYGTHDPVAKLSKSSLTFPATTVGQISAAQDIFVINYGDADLTVSSIVASGDFAQKNNCTAAIAPGKYCAIAVTFTPKATGTLTGAITITDNGISTTQKVTLTGTGQ
jgi:hypothetical protein